MMSAAPILDVFLFGSIQSSSTVAEMIEVSFCRHSEIHCPVFGLPRRFAPHRSHSYYCYLSAVFRWRSEPCRVSSMLQEASEVDMSFEMRPKDET